MLNRTSWGIRAMIFKGTYTAIVTPFTRRMKLDHEGLKRLVEFQSENKVQGIVVTGTTGESPTLSWGEHIRVVKKVYAEAGSGLTVIAGAGSNSTEEALKGVAECQEIGVKAVLLVDPYYNGPSSLEIRREYIEPVARGFPSMQVIPYIIPGRTGTQTYPQDLAAASSRYANISAVKDATGSLENAELVRKLCGNGFSILSGDDDKTARLMTDPGIRANGVVSVVSNVAPQAVSKMVEALGGGRLQEGEELAERLKPLFELVTVKTVEESPYGPVEVKARNPLPIKTLMQILGMPSGPCRRPLGKVTRRGLEDLLNKARRVYENSPEILRPVESFFDVDLGERLYKERFWQGLSYDGY
ncbi:MAG: 4-hydroxy-tetrahydrodipicolinate synthase [Candidatus Bathyarchaeia archaeon]